MKPQQQPAQDSAALEELGRASVQIIHDLKNQLNGLKLYATFLRKRAARDERPADECETVEKIIAGLERAAADTNVLVRFGRPLELNARPGTDLAKIVAAGVADVSDTFVPPGRIFRGDFDAQALTEALQVINAAVGAQGGTPAAKIQLSRAEAGGTPAAIVEWDTAQGARLLDAAATLSGSDGLRVALAIRIIRAHGGQLEHEANKLRALLPLTE